MPDITIIKLKIRRGTDAQRRTVVLEQGELGYAVDTGRVYIGDGITKGGNSISPIFHLPVNTQNLRTSTNATQGDIVNEAGWLYQLTGTDYRQLSAWKFIGSETDDTTIEYVDKGQRRVLQLRNNSVGANKFNSNAAYSLGGIVATPTNGLSANVDKSTVTINSNNQIKVGLINHTNIQSSSFNRGINGGSGSQIGLALNPNGGLGFVSNQLAVTSIPVGTAEIVAGNINFGSTFDTSKGINQDSPGALIYTRFYNYSPPISFNSADGRLGLSYNTSQFNATGDTLNLIEGNPPTGLSKTEKTGYLQSVIVNDRGRVTDTVSTVIDILSSRATNPGLTAFNGYALDPVTTTGISVRDSNNNVITLQSAGFLSLSGVTTQSGETIPGRIAIPIYLY